MSVVDLLASDDESLDESTVTGPTDSVKERARVFVNCVPKNQPLRGLAVMA